MAKLLPNQVTSEPLHYAPSNGLESCRNGGRAAPVCRLDQCVLLGCLDRPPGQPLRVTGGGAGRTGGFCHSGLLQGGVLSTLSYLAPI